MTERTEPIEKKIARLVDAAGGRTFYVGGFVRDKFMGRDNKDVDIEVHGIEIEKLREILSELGQPLEFGQSFGVWSLKGYDIDIAMPRREKVIGRGHRDFDIAVDPHLGTHDAAKRRDFTINSLMEDVLTGEVIDEFGGLGDLEAGIIRHIDANAFVEDPLRVLRGARFAARFGFKIDDATTELCRGIDIGTLSKERIEGEMKKALLKAPKPSIFFESLRAMEQLDVWFPEVEALIGIEQDPVFHPEGDVWVHTMEVVDRAAGLRDMASDAYSFMLLALTHDFGKSITTEFVKGRIHAYEHETKGLPIVEAFLERMVGSKDVRRYVRNMVPLHMRPNMQAYAKSSLKSTNRMFDAAVAPEDLIWFAMADKPVMSGDEEFDGDSGFLFHRLDEYNEIMARPHIEGRDLIAAGLEPGSYFTDVLEYAHKLRLAGIDKELAMPQVLAYARKAMKTCAREASVPDNAAMGEKAALDERAAADAIAASNDGIAPEMKGDGKNAKV